LQVNIKNLVDDGQCYQTVRELRWPDGVACPSCQSTQVITRGFDDTEPARQRYECTDWHTRFDDLTDTIFAGHHQPLKVWGLCLGFFAQPLEKVYFRNTPPEWPGEPFRKCLMFQHLPDCMGIASRDMT
jgi:hypothetical protein